MWVSPFGNLWVEAYLQLTTAYRSLSRPSSAPDAKAFTLRSCSLELLVYCSYTLVLFELSEFLLNISFRIILTLSRCEKTFSRLLHLILSFHLSVKLYAHIVCGFPFSFGKTKLSQRLFVLFCSFSTQIFLLLFDYQRSCGTFRFLVGLDGLEPSTSRLSGARSSHLSYKPRF